MKQKAHLARIKNAKKTISAKSKSTNNNNNFNTSVSKTPSHKVSDQAQLLLRLYENKNYESIPVYKLLRTANLQQYTKGFIIRGYGINLASLALLSQDDKKKFYEDIKVLPGHAIKLDNIIKLIIKQSYQDIFQDSQLISDTKSVSNSNVNISSATRSNRKEKTNYTNMTFNKNSNKTIDKQDEEYKKQLLQAMNQYTSPMMNQNKNGNKNVGLNNNNSQKRSSMLSTTGNHNQTNNNNNQNNNESKYTKTNYLPPKQTQKSTDFKKRVSQDPSTKSTIRKSSSIIHKQNKIQINKQQSSQQALNRLLKQNGVSMKNNNNVLQMKKIMQMDLQLIKIKDLYKSFDGAVMSSTIANLDIEQLVYAFAGYVSDIVIIGKQPQKNIHSQMDMQLRFNKNKTYEQNISFQINNNNNNNNNENNNNNFNDNNKNELIQDEIGSILRQSYMHPLYRQTNIMEDIQCDEVNSEGEHQEEDLETGGGSGVHNSIEGNNDNDNNNNNNKYNDSIDFQQNQNQFADNSMDKHMMESSFLGTQSFQFGLSQPIKIFQQPQPTQIDYFKPTVDSIFNFIKNIVLAAKMERQISVMAASYLCQFLQKSKIKLTSLNYKRLLVTCLLLASKIWDDESFETPSFSKTFPEYSTILLNQMQKQLLKYLQYKLKIDKKQYALTYFKLRKFIKKNIKSYQNRKLNIKKIRQLQNGIRNQYKTNYLVKRNSF